MSKRIMTITPVPDIPVKDFEHLLEKTVKYLNAQAALYPLEFKDKGGLRFERIVEQALKKTTLGTAFKPDDIKLVSGHSFPDIIAGHGYGVEVKTTDSDQWHVIGGSITESTRNEAVAHIYLLFANLGHNPPLIKCRPYAEVIEEVRVSHSPRFILNMELGNNETFFHRLGITYEDFRKRNDKVAQVRKFYREKAEKEGKKEIPWWLEGPSEASPFSLVHWTTVPAQQKSHIKAELLLLFPDLLLPKVDYSKAALWLCSYHYVVTHSFRDLFSAGGRGRKLRWRGSERSIDVDAKIKNLVNLSPVIREVSENTEFGRVIEEYNPEIYHSRQIFDKWLNRIASILIEIKVSYPVLDWIQEGARITE